MKCEKCNAEMEEYSEGMKVFYFCKRCSKNGETIHKFGKCVVCNLSIFLEPDTERTCAGCSSFLHGHCAFYHYHEVEPDIDDDLKEVSIDFKDNLYCKFCHSLVTRSRSFSDAEDITIKK